MNQKKRIPYVQPSPFTRNHQNTERGTLDFSRLKSRSENNLNQDNKDNATGHNLNRSETSLPSNTSMASRSSSTRYVPPSPFTRQAGGRSSRPGAMRMILGFDSSDDPPIQSKSSSNRYVPPSPFNRTSEILPVVNNRQTMVDDEEPAIPVRPSPEVNYATASAFHVVENLRQGQASCSTSHPSAMRMILGFDSADDLPHNSRANERDSATVPNASGRSSHPSPMQMILGFDSSDDPPRESRSSSTRYFPPSPFNRRSEVLPVVNTQQTMRVDEEPRRPPPEHDTGASAFYEMENARQRQASCSSSYPSAMQMILGFDSSDDPPNESRSPSNRYVPPSPFNRTSEILPVVNTRQTMRVDEEPVVNTRQMRVDEEPRRPPPEHDTGNEARVFVPPSPFHGMDISRERNTLGYVSLDPSAPHVTEPSAPNAIEPSAPTENVILSAHSPSAPTGRVINKDLPPSYFDVVNMQTPGGPSASIPENQYNEPPPPSYDDIF